MTIEKLPNGSYRIRQQMNGRRYSKTLPYKPTQREASLIMSELCTKPKFAVKGTLSEYIDKYIVECQKRGLSPSSIAGYRSIQRNLPTWFLKMQFYEINQTDIIRAVKDYSSAHSVKSTQNARGLIKPIFALYRPQIVFPTISIQSGKRAVKRTNYEPTTAEVLRILEYAHGTRYEVPLQLLCLGIRRGELIALELSDIDENNVLHITKSLSVGTDGKYHLKEPKTESSRRSIQLPQSLAELIRETGIIFSGNPHTLNEYLHKVQDRLGIQRFNLHMLRHFSAAFLLSQGWDAEAVREWHGWAKGSSVMNRVYNYNLDGESKLKGISESYGALLDGKKTT